MVSFRHRRGAWEDGEGLAVIAVVDSTSWYLVRIGERWSAASLLTEQAIPAPSIQEHELLTSLVAQCVPHRKARGLPQSFSRSLLLVVRHLRHALIFTSLVSV